MSFRRTRVMLTLAAFGASLLRPLVSPAGDTSPAAPSPTPAATTAPRTSTSTSTTTSASASSSPSSRRAPVEDPAFVQARDAFNAGLAAMQENHPDQALEHFRRAMELRPTPEVHRAMAAAHERSGHIPDAIASLEAFLAAAPTSRDRAAVEKQLQDLRARPATLHITSDPAGAVVTVDDQSRGTTPIDLTVAPGHHVIKLTLADRTPSEQAIDVVVGEQKTVAVTLAPDAASASDAGASSSDDAGALAATGDAGASDDAEAIDPSADESTDEEKDKGPGAGVWVGVAIASSTLVAGTVFGFLALGDKAEYDANPTRETLERGRTNAVLSDIFLVGSIAAAAVTTFAYLGTRKPPASATSNANRAAVHVFPTPTGLLLTF